MDRKGAPPSGQSDQPVQPVHRATDSVPLTPLQVDYQGNHPVDNVPPPLYSSPSGQQSRTPAPPQVFPGLPKLNYAWYSPPTFKLSSDETTVISHKPEYSNSPTTLHSFIQEQAQLPPKAQIRIKATRDGNVDFDLKLNMMALLVGNDDQNQRWNYLKVVEDPKLAARRKSSVPPSSTQRGIGDWVKQYCDDPAAIKEFTIERQVHNWDVGYIEGQLRTLIASIGYKYAVDITFPSTYGRVTVHSPDKINKVFTAVESFFSGTKKYEVVKVVWPYASAPPGDRDRRFAVQSEESWWHDWKDVIRYAIVTRRQGWVTVEDRLDSLMAPEPDRKLRSQKLWSVGIP
ncbi:MAG: hypothetical protein M1824_002645 [Vezdaea acicularis]|nr:MAG: hypothetical protein M1824_002645 [Vezdaea acicularis]